MTTHGGYHFFKVIDDFALGTPPAITNLFDIILFMYLTNYSSLMSQLSRVCKENLPRLMLFNLKYTNLIVYSILLLTGIYYTEFTLNYQYTFGLSLLGHAIIVIDLIPFLYF